MLPRKQAGDLYPVFAFGLECTPITVRRVAEVLDVQGDGKIMSTASSDDGLQFIAALDFRNEVEW